MANDRPPRSQGAVTGGLRTARVIAGGIVRKLPGRRGPAALALARDARTLLTGGGPATTALTAGDEPINPIALVRAQRALSAGDDLTALTRADAILATHPSSYPALAVRASALARRGEPTAALGAVRAMRALRDSTELQEMERTIFGRLLESDPNWLPRIADPRRPLTPRSPGAVMHLLKESLPQRQNGYTMRSRYTLLAQQAAGLDPFVITALGFPRSISAEPVLPVEIVDGIAHHRLDLGPAWPKDAPLDLVLTDTAWLASRIAQREKPAILHAGSGFRGYDTARVGLALREHLEIPFVYEVRSFMESTWTDDDELGVTAEVGRRRVAAEERAMLAADAVLTIGEAMRDDLVGRGVPVDRITVVPNGVDPAAFEPVEPDASLQRRYGLEGKAVIGYVSTMDHPREGHEVLIEATARLARAGRNVACLLVGDGARRPALEALARKSGVAAEVVFTGRVPHAQVRHLYALLDVFVVPRVEDRAARLVTPLKPFEALAMACPLVVSDLPALLEIAAPDQRGLAFQAGDPEALAAALGTLLDRPELARRMGEAGRTWVLSERTWAANGPRYLAAYEMAREAHRAAARLTR